MRRTLSCEVRVSHFFGESTHVQSKTYRVLRRGTATSAKVDLIMPSTINPANDIPVRDVFDPRGLVVLHIALVYYTLNLVLSPPEPALFEIMKDDLEPSLFTCYEAGVGHGNVKRA